MLVPLSWIKDYVAIDDIPLEELAHKLTLAGLEVEEIRLIGLSPSLHAQHYYKVSGLAWEREKIVVGEILEVMPHPNADRLVLCRLNDGQREHMVLTGAPNLFEYKGQGALKPSLKAPYAREGARIYDGHQEGYVLTTLKPTRIRGVDSYSMICSEKELGISDEHEGILLLPEDAPAGTPLADYMGDALLDIAITPNIARNANMLGVAREIAAIFKRPLHEPEYSFLADGEPIEGQVELEIIDPELNPRFLLGLIKNVEIKPSPAWVQRRLRLVGQRPINNIVDVTNYIMFAIGQPLHAFDYDVLLKRAGGKPPAIVTRRAGAGEKLVTLDGEEHQLEEFTVLVCDTAGSHSIAGIMGGIETEVTGSTRNVLLEGAHWNYINIRRSLGYLRMHSEASYRFSRGVHPAMAERGVKLGLELMRQWSGGVVCSGLVEKYPHKAVDPLVEITSSDVRRSLGIELSAQEIGNLLSRLGFTIAIHGEKISAQTPDHRLDIDSDPLNAKADLLEEIARIYGYENIPQTRIADMLPVQRNTPDLDFEEKVRDILVDLGLQEVITYRLTSAEREARSLPPEFEAEPRPYVEVANPIAADRHAMRKNLLASVLEIIESNARHSEHIAIFEIGAVYLASEDSMLPDEQSQLCLALTGLRHSPVWQEKASEKVDFFDLKGVVEGLLAGLHISDVNFLPHKHPSFHPGKCARVEAGGAQVGVIGELHPIVQQQYAFLDAPVLAAIFYMDALRMSSPERHEATPVSMYPSVLEDIALIVDEEIPAAQVSALITQTGGKAVTDVRLFDVFRGERIGTGKKSLAYSLCYQASDRTLTDEEVAKIRNKIVRRLETELGAQLRSF